MNKETISILAVKDFSNNSQSEFCVDVEVFEDEEKKYDYHNIGFIQAYNVGYMQHDVQLFWEEDKTQPKDFSKRKLRGIYNTNFHDMIYENEILIIDDHQNGIKLYITK